MRTHHISDRNVLRCPRKKNRWSAWCIHALMASALGGRQEVVRRAPAGRAGSSTGNNEEFCRNNSHSDVDIAAFTPHGLGLTSWVQSVGTGRFCVSGGVESAPQAAESGPSAHAGQMSPSPAGWSLRSSQVQSLLLTSPFQPFPSPELGEPPSLCIAQQSGHCPVSHRVIYGSSVSQR